MACSITGCKKDKLLEQNFSENVSRSYITPEMLDEQREYYLNKKSQLLAQAIYSEAANQPLEAKKEVARIINGRIQSDKYPNSLEGVLLQKNAFPSVGGKLWSDVDGRRLNNYELKVLNECYKIAREVLTDRLQTENEAYHDTSISKPRDSFWKGLILDKQVGNLVFYKRSE